MSRDKNLKQISVRMGHPLNHCEVGGEGKGVGGFLLPILLFWSYLFYLYRTTLTAVAW